METSTTETIHESSSLSADNQKLGIWTFISSETVFFSALIVTYIALHERSVTGPMPREVLSVPITSVNTFILICSSFSMVSALAAVRNGDQKKLKAYLIATLALGFAFLGGQALEFTLLAQEGLSLSVNLFGATFYTLTGFHGAHVLIGAIWIIFVLVRAFRGQLTREKHASVELVGLYWHFVDLVWIIIFTVIYLI